MLVALLTVLTVYGQRTVTGRVTDKDGEGIPGANVVIKGTTKGVTTDIDGTFQITVDSEDDILVFSSVGLETQEIVVAGRTVIDVSMTEESRVLEELVVVGYGTQQKRDVSGSVASIGADRIENIPTPSIDRVLQGKTAGVQITGNSGIPGGSVQVRIRGDGSINAGSDPLYIVDGVMVQYGDNTSLLSSTNALASINPNDIESVDVLKDAAAASIYGAQAANGVVIITTKKGKKGRTQFEFNASTGVTQNINEWDVMTASQWINYHETAFENTYGPNSSQWDSFIAQWGEADEVENNDWQDLVFDQGTFENYELSMRGGSENTNFFVSGSYNNTKAHIIAAEFERVTLRSNIDQKVSDKLKVGTNLSLSGFYQRQPSEGGFFVAPAFSAPAAIPAESPYDEDGNFQDVVSASGTNLLRWYNLSSNTGVTVSTIARMYVEYSPIENLKWRSSGAIENVSIRTEDYWHPDTNDGQGLGGLNQSRHQRLTSYQTDHTLSYDKTFNSKHAVSALMGMNYRSDKSTNLYAAGGGFSNGLLSTISNAANPLLVNGSNTEWKLAGVFARFGYIYDDKYIASVTVRRDGSSRFGSDNRWGTFPAVSLAWRASSESFMEGISFLEELKVRASYGETGNHLIGNFDYAGLVATGGSYAGQGSLTPSNIANPLLQWETNIYTNVGIDFSLFQGRLGGSLDYYIRDTEDLLLDKPIPATNGFTTITDNVGAIRNTGFEIELNSTNLAIGDFLWTTDFNISFQDSEVMRLADGDTLIIANAGETYIVGQEMNAFYLQRWAGVNPADGRPMWYDENGNIVFNNASGNTRTVVGSANPDAFGGLTNSFSYKGLELVVFLQYQFGNLINNTQRGYLLDAGNSGGTRGLLTENNRSWSEPGDVTDMVVPLVGATSYANGADDANSTNNTRFLEYGDYVRLKEIVLGYTLPRDLTERAGFQRIRVYTTGVNLITWTKFKGYDPEITGSGFGVVPQGRVYTVGVQLGF